MKRTNYESEVLCVSVKSSNSLPSLSRRLLLLIIQSFSSQMNGTECYLDRSFCNSHKFSQKLAYATESCIFEPETI